MAVGARYTLNLPHARQSIDCGSHAQQELPGEEQNWNSDQNGET